MNHEPLCQIVAQSPPKGFPRRRLFDYDYEYENDDEDNVPSSGSDLSSEQPAMRLP